MFLTDVTETVKKDRAEATDPTTTLAVPYFNTSAIKQANSGFN